MKTLLCRDAGFDCDKKIHGLTEEAVLAQAAEHALKVHQVKVTPELANQIKTLIKDDGGVKSKESGQRY
jgi:predicted small metal-binding protein